MNLEKRPSVCWLKAKGQSGRLREFLARHDRELETDIGKLKDSLITDFHAFFTP